MKRVSGRARLAVLIVGEAVGRATEKLQKFAFGALHPSRSLADTE
jgi:hypothetical protein